LRKEGRSKPTQSKMQLHNRMTQGNNTESGAREPREQQGVQFCNGDGRKKSREENRKGGGGGGGV